MAHDLEALLVRLLKRRSAMDYPSLVHSVCSAVPFNSLANDDRDRAVSAALNTLSTKRNHF